MEYFHLGSLTCHTTPQPRPPHTEPGFSALSPQPSSKLTLIITLALLALRATDKPPGGYASPPPKSVRRPCGWLSVHHSNLGFLSRLSVVALPDLDPLRAPDPTARLSPEGGVAGTAHGQAGFSQRRTFLVSGTGRGSAPMGSQSLPGQGSCLQPRAPWDRLSGAAGPAVKLEGWEAQGRALLRPRGAPGLGRRPRRNSGPAAGTGNCSQGPSRGSGWVSGPC